MIQKIKQRRERTTNVAEWVAVIPQSDLKEYGPRLASEGIHVAMWYQTRSRAYFSLAERYPVQDP